MQDIAACAKISTTPQTQLLHVLRAPVGDSAEPGDDGEYALAELVSTGDPAATLANLQETQRHWQRLGLPEYTVLDVLRMEAGRGMALVLRRLPMPICMAMRSAVHAGVRLSLAPASAAPSPRRAAIAAVYLCPHWGCLPLCASPADAAAWRLCAHPAFPQQVQYHVCGGVRGESVAVQVFKNVPTAQQLHEGVVGVDTSLVLSTLLHAARAVACLHAAGAVHGGICDTSLVVTMAAPKATAGVAWRHGRDVQLSFATLGVALDVDEPVHRVDLAEARADLPLFYAPERFDADGMLTVPTPAGDIWALGMLLIYCMRLSLPLVRDGVLVRHPHPVL